jgi:hypothetical protein
MTQTENSTGLLIGIENTVQRTDWRGKCYWLWVFGYFVAKNV